MGTRCNEFKLVSLLSLFYHEVQQREDAVIIYCIMACCNSSRNIRILRDLYPKATKGIGHFSKVWVFQLGTRDSAGIITFLVGADGAIFLIEIGRASCRERVYISGGDRSVRRKRVCKRGSKCAMHDEDT